MKRVVKGINYGIRGFSLIFKNRKLTLLALVPFFVQLLLFGIGVYLTLYYLGDWSDGILRLLPLDTANQVDNGFFNSLINKLVLGIYWLLKVILLLVLLVIQFLILYLLGTIIASPFYDLISEVTESILGLKDETPLSFKRLLRSTWVTIGIEIKKVLLFSTIAVFTLLLSLIPFLGTVINLFVLNIYAAMVFTFTFCDYPMSRRDWSLGQRLKFAENHYLEYLGFGLLFFIPVINFVAGPAFVVGATVLFVEHDQS